MSIKKNILDEKRVSFICIDVEEGQLLLRRTKGIYECWTVADGCGHFVYQFGVKCKDMKEFKKLVMENYFVGNVFFEE